MTISSDQNIPATVLGATIGLIKGFITFSLAIVSWTVILDTAILALVGGVVGWSVSEFLKFLKNKFKKLKNK